MSTPSSTGIGARLRALRGERSQEDFAKAIGITRSALANYETERTLPKPSLLRLVAKTVGISDDYLFSGAIRNEYELNLVATGKGDLNHGQETTDEMAIVRTLRATMPSTVCAVVAAILEDIGTNAESRGRLEAVTATNDLARLGQILQAGGVFEKGRSAQDVDAFLAALANRAKAQQP